MCLERKGRGRGNGLRRVPLHGLVRNRGKRDRSGMRGRVRDGLGMRVRVRDRLGIRVKGG